MKHLQIVDVQRYQALITISLPQIYYFIIVYVRLYHTVQEHQFSSNIDITVEAKQTWKAQEEINSVPVICLNNPQPRILQREKKKQNTSIQ